MMPSRSVADGPVCARRNPDIWSEPESKALAVTLCGACPLRAECLVDSAKLTYEQARHVVAGGLLPYQREKVWRKFGKEISVTCARDILQHVK